MVDESGCDVEVLWVLVMSETVPGVSKKRPLGRPPFWKRTARKEGGKDHSVVS